MPKDQDHRGAQDGRTIRNGTNLSLQMPSDHEIMVDTPSEAVNASLYHDVDGVFNPETFNDVDDSTQSTRYHMILNGLYLEVLEF